MLWNCVDVRDTAEAHRLAMESHACKNGSRYILAAADRSGELFTRQLQAKMADLAPVTPRVQKPSRRPSFRNTRLYV